MNRASGMQIEVTTIASRWSATIRDTTERNRNNLFLPGLFFLGDQVTDTAQGVDMDRGADFGEVLADPMNIDLYRIRADFLRQPIEIVFQQRLGDDPSAPAQQMLEHGDLARREENRLVSDKHLAGDGVERDVAQLQGDAEEVAWPPQQRL